ncbi:MAG TPA: histidine kinase dimerization/phospho-acceptor domain-containing protein [Polyangiaceae bacterium]|nr:histidine kinase dimerization/phospho-acceptor domain-containing protein [Polyangiaceae bacterium]
MAGEGRAQVGECLSQTLKIEPVDALTGSLAHDLNNLLSVVMTYTVLVMEELKPDDPALADLEEVRAAAERAAELTRELLKLGKRSVLSPCA